MADLIEGIKLVGGLAGLTTLGFKLYEESTGYLKVKVQVNQKENNSILTEIENSSKWFNKNIDNAFLIISPELSDLIETGKKIATKLELTDRIESTNQFEKFTCEEPLYFDNQFAFIPLAYYYSENIAIGDEKLNYRCSVDESQFEKGNYSVRFYIYGKKRYHRSTQDLIIFN